MGTATAAFGLPAVAGLLWLRKIVFAASASRAGERRNLGIGLAALLLCLLLLPFKVVPGSGAASVSEPPPGYRAAVYVIDDAGGPAGQHFGGVDDLVLWMGLNGLKLFQSNTQATFEAGPTGIIAEDDVVVIKINYQWDQRGGTNVDVLRGLIRRIVDHPDGFSGEIAVCENAQFNPVSNFDRAANNAAVSAMSPHDVVVEFQNAGYAVSHYDWTAIRNLAVAEYSTGDMTDGYILVPYDAALQGRISYPKFQTSAGTRISLKYGLWQAGAYDRARLKFINMPVLKSHHSTYGVTACVKDYMGVVTGALSTNSHNAIRYGLLGGLLGEIHLADLNILDCIWVNANPFSGPSTTYAGATLTNKLVAGIDPVAIDMWAAKNILIPAFVANGYAPPWPAPSADPDDPASAFRTYLDNSMNRILAVGYDVTNNLNQIDASRWNGDRGEAGDVNGDGRLDGADLQGFVDLILGADSNPLHALRADLDRDLDIDMDDNTAFVQALLESARGGREPRGSYSPAQPSGS